MRSIRFVLAAAVVCSAVAFAGCGGGDDDDDDDDDDDSVDGGADDAGNDAPVGAITLDVLCGESGIYADYYGQYLACNPVVALGLGGDVTPADISALCRGQLGPYVEDGTIGLGDAAALETCEAYLAGLTCADLEVANPTACAGLFVGTVAIGGDCERDDQCIGAAFCGLDKDGGCNACTAQLPDGEACGGDAECLTGHCRDDAFCGGLSALAGPCASNDDCQGDAVCDTDDGQCIALPAVGDPCLGNCGLPSSGRYCDLETDTCADQVALGEACNDPLACHLLDQEWCDEGLCALPTDAGEGEPCGVLFGGACTDGLRCSQPASGQPGVCFVPGGPGDACDPEDPAAGCDVFLECFATICGYIEYTGVCPAPG